MGVLIRFSGGTELRNAHTKGGLLDWLLRYGLGSPETSAFTLERLKSRKCSSPRIWMSQNRLEGDLESHAAGLC